MDIKTRIEDVISQKGITKKEVAERMGKFNQAFNSLITNPKWDTIELVAQAIGITTEELLFGDDRITKEEAKSNSISKAEEGTTMHDNEQQSNAHSFGVIICPYCRKGIRLSLVKG